MSSSPSLIIEETEVSPFDENGSLSGIDHAAASVPELTLTNNSQSLESMPTDFDSVGGGAAPFETDFLTEIIQKKDIPVRVQTDSTGRSYYYFNNDINNSTTVIVFEVLGKKMVNISSTILTLDTLLSLKQCIHHKPSGVHPLEQIELRSTPIPASWFGSVECTFGNGETLVINDMSIDLMMNIVSHMSSIYGKEPTETKLTDETHVPEPVIPKQIINMTFDPIVPTLSAGFLLGASLTTIGYFLGKYKF